MEEALFAEYPGGNCAINGMHGYVTEFHKEGPHVVGAFIKIPAGPMLFVRLGRSVGEKHREVVSVREVSRDEFDRITTLDELRYAHGWRS